MIDTARARAMIEAIWNDGDLDAIDELYAENFVGHDPQNPLQGREAMRAWVIEARTNVRDIHINLHETITEGDISVTRWTVSGTFAADWRSMPITGKTFVVPGMTMSKFEGDKVVESWIHTDNLGMLQQVGIVPEMAEQ